MTLFLAGYFLAGLVAGSAYFLCVRWTARRIAGAGATASVIAVTVARFVLLGGLLFLVSLRGAMPLLTMALGVLAARFVVMRAAAA